MLSGEKLTAEKVIGGAISGAVTGFVLGITKGAALATASYTSAAVESTFYEVCSYAKGEKEFTGENIVSSILNIAVDTGINGTINYICNQSAANIKSIKTNSGWFVPKTVKSYLTKTFGQRMMLQTTIAGAECALLYSIKERIKRTMNINVSQQNKDNQIDPICLT